MGTTAHIANKSQQINVRHNGQTIAVCPLVFLCMARDLDAWGDFLASTERRRRINLRNARIARTEAAWGDQGPEYVVLADEPKEGCNVYRRGGEGNVPRSVVVYDCDKIGEVVGVLRKVGRSWSIMPVPVLNRYAETLVRLLSDGAPHTQTICTEHLRNAHGLSEALCQAVIDHAWIKGLARQCWNPELKVQCVQLSDKGRTAMESDELSAYWTDLVPVAS